ncbi:unnamed protein product [Mycena citricolor]|uniref:Amidohydrolase 3 domain-containing protein n=1 Tax=Mycena citricolor TaxID=2018698 RepID=A0AAD2K6W7_9AGAR|nr:unnamed protein product [Mycena citricolor]
MAKVDSYHVPKAARRPTRYGLVLSLVSVTLISYFAYSRESYTVCSSTHSIYIVDEVRPTAECISVHKGRISAVGSMGMVQRFMYPLAVRLLEPGQIIVPGFSDAHAHFLQQGYKMQLQLDNAKSVEEVVDRIKTYINAHPEVKEDKTRWIEGMGWDQTKWAGASFPSAADLSRDPLLAGRPIHLLRVDVHAAWVSERVLELIDPLPADGDVDGGIIVRDGSGKPTGIFVDNAMALIPSPPWAPDQYSQFFETVAAEALKFGLTTIHDAATDPVSVAFFKQVADSGKLPLRLYLMASPAGENFTNWDPMKVEKLINYGPQERLTLRSVKLFTDGALGSWGAALIEPYADQPNMRGILRSPPETMDGFIRDAWNAGLQVNVHCIGDRANQVVLDIFEKLQLDSGVSVADYRPRIEHAQILQTSDLIRIGRLGVIPSVQPTHGTSDMGYAESRLGPERIKGAYAYQTLLQSSPKKILPLGSDFPVEGVNPLLGFYAAVSRLDPDGNSPHGPGGWFPSERLTRAQALKGMTLDAAYASFSEGDLGSLVVGKRADFVVLDRDIMTVDLGDILDTKVVATVIDGKVEYGSIPSWTVAQLLRAYAAQK